MAKSKRANRYPPEFQRRVIEMVRSGRKISELARELGCTGWTISRWMRRAEGEAAAGRGEVCSERRELSRLRQENRQLRRQRDVLSQAAAWFAQGSGLHLKRSAGS